MTVRDICDVAPDVDVPVDVCIVGSGPAGMTIAHELAAAGRRVTVLESGGVADAGEAGDLSEIESVGAPRVMDQELVRVRGLGGTSRVWSGRLATFDETDFRERSWVPGSGWPLTRDDVGRYFARAAGLLGGPVADNNAPSECHERATGVLPAFDPAVFRRYFWTFSSDPAGRGAFLWFGRDLDACRRSDIEFVVNATVTQLVPDPVQQKIASVEVSGPDRRIRTFVPNVVILAAGGIENPRLLLASDRVRTAGVGNQHDQVGRYLMDHPRGPVASYTGSAGDRVAQLLGNVQLEPISKVRDRRSATVGVALSPELQEAEGLLNCSMWVVPQRSPRDPLSSLQDIVTRRSGSSTLNDLRAAAAGAPVLAQGFLDVAVRGRSPRRLLERLDIYCMVEQGPDPLSRITLSSRRDRLGVPVARVDWKIGASEARTVRRAAGLFSSEMARLAHPVPELAPQIADDSVPFHFPDIAHPTGTTRMSASPGLGVVDQDCRVHGLENLYVAGSSVFPTSGHANPTQMIVAMALRLAHFVARAHAPKVVSVGRETTTVAPVPTESGSVAPASVGRVLVTGARGKVGRLLVTRLVERGYRVRALTSGAGDSVTGAPEAVVEWRTCDLALQQSFDDGVLDDVDAVVHLAALQRGEALQAVNVDATVALLDACERAGVALFCFLSSASVYGSPRVFSSTAEHAQTIDEHTPVERQYWTNAELQAYGRSKKAAEEGIVDRHKGITHCVVFRPTVIVDSADLQGRRAAIRRGPGLNPRALQLVHNEDVVSAILWALERTPSSAEAGVEIFNLADNDASCRHESDVKALLDGGGHRLARTSRGVLKVLYWCGSAARFYRGGPLRLPIGLASYPNERLLLEGFTFTRGMRAAWIGLDDADEPADATENDSATSESVRA